MTDDNMGTAEQNIEVTETSAEPTQDTKTFTQDEVDAIVKARLAKYSKKYESIDLNEYKSLKQEQETKKLEEQKARGEFETILQQQKQDFDAKLNTMKSQLEREKVDGALLNAASKNSAINPEQVKDLLKGNVKLTDDGKVEILAENKQPMYNKDGDLKSIDEYVKDFITDNPHFQTATPSGSGSKANLGKVDAKPFNLADLDMTKPEDRKQYAEYKKARDKNIVIDLTNK